MIDVRSVAQVRAAEEEAFAVLPEGALMQRAAHALAITCARLLTDETGGVVGTRVVLLIGAGNNGGDALWAGADLARRGARVDAVCLSERMHAEGAAALRRAGGRLHAWPAAGDDVAAAVASADLVIDGILGIGGKGGLRPDASALVDLIDSALVVAVDVPSGVDADTGAVEGAAVVADVTVTFGAVKPGLLVAPGRFHSGAVQLVDIGLAFDTDPVAVVLEESDIAAFVPEPAEDAYKYRRGVVGISAGSRAYPGAALLVTAAARHANVGMTRFLDRDDGTAPTVVAHFPDIVIDGSPPREQVRATAWGCGSGFPGDHLDEVTVLAILEAAVPVVLDAGALSVVAASDAVRGRIADRRASGLVTVLTPHEGEFARLAPGVLDAAAGRIDAARTAAAALEAVIVLKGPGTVIVDPSGDAFLDTEGTSDLGVAGSGDVLTGLVAALLADTWAQGYRDSASLTESVAAAVWLHGRAGREAGRTPPVVATDVAAAVPAAIQAARRAGAER